MGAAGRSRPGRSHFTGHANRGGDYISHGHYGVDEAPFERFLRFDAAARQE
jgi:hypothetical protein